MEDDPLWKLGNELRDVLPLSALSEADGRELVSHMRVRRLEEGELVYHRHDPAADAFVVRDGLVKSVLQHWEGRELLLGLYGRGQFFGTLALFDPEARRDSTVIAAMPTTVLQVPREDVVRVLLRNPVAMHFMARRYIRMIRRLQRQVEIHLSLNTSSRLALFLIELEHLPHRVHLSQEQIAGAIGLDAPSTTWRAPGRASLRRCSLPTPRSTGPRASAQPTCSRGFGPWRRARETRTALAAEPQPVVR